MSLWRLVWNSYEGEGVFQKARIVLSILVAGIVAFFTMPLNSTNFDLISVTISILTGFTFTALLSGASSVLPLPFARDETDRRELIRLSKVEGNFKARAELLIFMSVVSLVIILFLGLDPRPFVLEFGDSLSGLTLAGIPLWHALREVSSFAEQVATLLLLAFFFEILYLFYRLTESVIAILDLRKRYLKERDPD